MYLNSGPLSGLNETPTLHESESLETLSYNDPARPRPPMTPLSVSATTPFYPQIPLNDVMDSVYFLSTVLPKRSEKWLKHFKETCEEEAVIHQYPVANAMDSHQHVVWEFRSTSLSGLISSLQKLVTGIPEKNVPPQCVGRTPMRKVSYRLLIPSKLAYRIIGVQGQTIQRMRDALLCDIFVSQTTCRLTRILCFVTTLQDHHRLCSGLRLVAFANALIGGMHPIDDIMKEAEFELTEVEFSVFKVMAKSREEQKMATDPTSFSSQDVSRTPLPKTPPNYSMDKPFNFPLRHDSFSASRSLPEGRSFNTAFGRSFPSSMDARSFRTGETSTDIRGSFSIDGRSFHAGDTNSVEARANSLFMRSNSIPEYTAIRSTPQAFGHNQTFEEIEDKGWMQPERNAMYSRFSYWSSEALRGAIRPQYDSENAFASLGGTYDRSDSLPVVVPGINHRLAHPSPPMKAQPFISEYNDINAID